MIYPVSSLAGFDAALLHEYAQFRSLLPAEPDPVVQRRFAQYGVFPKLGWALIGVGEQEALAAEDPSLLHATLTRFLKCAHHCWGPTDETGLHWGGQDFSALVVPALYSAPLGRAYAAAAFHGGRPMSRTGHGASVHAANLMVCLECPAWPQRAKAVARAEAFVSARSRPQADQAFVRFFLAILAQDAPAVAEALGAFADAYGRSDWGRHKPWTAPVFLQGLITYASRHLASPVDAATHGALVSADRIWLWAAMDRSLDQLALAPHRFAGPLDFLNDLSIT